MVRSHRAFEEIASQLGNRITTGCDVEPHQYWTRESCQSAVRPHCYWDRLNGPKVECFVRFLARNKKKESFFHQGDTMIMLLGDGISQ